MARQSMTLCSVTALAYLRRDYRRNGSAPCHSRRGSVGGVRGGERVGIIGMAALRPAVIMAMLLSVPVLARAGGVALTDEDINSGANGPSFFGFVRVVDGPGIDDAKVTAELKGGALVTATDILGLYKIPGFGQGVNPDDVQISCAKSGYKQANVVRRPHPAGDIKDPIEVDCYLQKQ
jgi:hypothetical protein